MIRFFSFFITLDFGCHSLTHSHTLSLTLTHSLSLSLTLTHSLSLTRPFALGGVLARVAGAGVPQPRAVTRSVLLLERKVCLLLIEFNMAIMYFLVISGPKP